MIGFLIALASQASAPSALPTALPVQTATRRDADSVTQTQIFATNIGSWVIPGTLCAALYLAMSLPLADVSRRLERRCRVTAS